jgi:hypothetical protein
MPQGRNVTMVKIISEGLAQPDDPIFSGGVQTFSVRWSPPSPPVDVEEEPTPPQVEEPEPEKRSEASGCYVRFTPDSARSW